MTKPKPKSSIADLISYRPEIAPAGAGEKIIRLSANESALGASPKATQALKDLDSLSLYPEQISTDLIEAIAQIEKLNPQWILPSNGSDELISLLATAFLEPNDEAIYTQYGFLVFPQAIRVAGGVAVMAKDDNLTVSVDSIIEKLSDKTKLIFLANPNNPTGTMIPRAELERLIAKTPTSVVIVLDSAYAEYVPSDNSDYTNGADLVEKHQNVVMLRTFSKIYGLASLRLGWGYMQPDIFNTLSSIRSPFSVNALAAYAGTAAIADRDFVATNHAHNQKWLTIMQDSIRQAGFETLPSVANFFLIRLKDEKTASQAHAFLEERGILLRHMKPYGLPDCLRMSLGTDKQMEYVANVFKELGNKS